MEGLFTVSLLLLVCGHSSFAETEAEIKTLKFTSIPCVDQNIADILKANPINEYVADSISRCAVFCLNQEECNFAVFRQSAKTCKHIQVYDGNITKPPPPYASENDCFVLLREDKPICQNGGSFHGTYPCVCRIEYQGGQCEEDRPSFCASSLWRTVSEMDYTTLQDSLLEIKLVLPYGTSQSQLSNVYHFAMGGSKIQFESQNYLSVDMSSESFESELKREFIHYSGSTGIVSTKRVSMPGVVTTTQSSVYGLMVRGVVDRNRTAYQPGVQENLTYLTDNLYAGHRVLVRYPTRTDFDRKTGDVVFQRAKAHVGASATGFLNPIYFYSVKYIIKEKKFQATRWIIATGNHTKSETWSKSTNVELDRCWVKLPSCKSEEDMLGLLRELVLSQGREIRIIMAASIATDVTMVTVTDSDVIVALAEYLTPSDAFSALGSYSKIRFSIMSLSNMLLECDMTFQGKTVHSIKVGSSPSSLEWVASSRFWQMTFVITSGGSITSGSHEDVYSAASSGHNIRVCVEMSANATVCFTGTTLNLDDSGKHVMLQSHPALSVGLNKDRTFSGIVESDCRRTAYLVSTKGWVKSATYVIGVADPPDAIVSVTFLKITWFCQD